MCSLNQSGGKTPPAGNVLAAVCTTPPHATEDASDDPFVQAAEKCRARCHGPSCEVAVMPNHCLNSPNRSARESCARSTVHLSDFSSSAITANIACVQRDAGRIATVMLMHLPAIRCSVPGMER